jgi:hypothetical protein
LRAVFQWLMRPLPLNAGPETQAFSRAAVSNIRLMAPQPPALSTSSSQTAMWL